MPADPFAPRYTPAQREAARRELRIGIKPAEVCRRAADGELAPGLEPFTLAPGTARTWRDQERAAAKREAAAAATAGNPGDVIAQLRGELLAAISAELRDVKRRQARRSDCRHCKARTERVSGEELRQLGRALREANALVPGGSAPPEHSAPGSSAPSRQPVPGIAGAILTEHRRSAHTEHTYRETAQDDQPLGDGGAPLPDGSTASNPENGGPGGMRSLDEAAAQGHAADARPAG